MENPNVLPLRKAAEEIGIADLDTLRKAAKKFGALVTVAGLDYVDRARFDEGVKNELQMKVEQGARRASTKASGGQHLGLMKARIELGPVRIVKKESDVAAARNLVDKAQNAYEKVQAKKTLAGLEAGLARLKDNLAKDQADLERFLNEYEG